MTFNLQTGFIKRWQICYLLFFMLSCHAPSSRNESVKKRDSVAAEIKANAAFAAIHAAYSTVQSGDLVLRTGKDFTSDLMRHLSKKDQTYSHCGIASWENDTLFVYHALGGEWNPDQKLRRDPFGLFCNPFENRGFGVYRYSLSSHQNSELIQTIHRLYEEGTRFDAQFDLTTNDRLYCSELIFKSLKEASGNSILLPTTTWNHKEFVSIENLFANSFCKPVKKVRF